jgi:hypothetical protein
MPQRGRFGLSACVGALLMVCAAVGSAAAQSSEDRYITDRDRAIQKFANVKPSDAATSAEEKARAGLEKQMLAIVGPLKIPSYGAPKLNLETLFKGDMGFGTLDGLVLQADGDKGQMVVTTRPLLTRWLREHRNWWDDTQMPPEPDAAFRLEAFYTQAISTDAAIVRFVDIPLDVPDKPVVATLGWRTQDNAPNAAGEVYVAAVRGERAFVSVKELEPPFEIEACTTPRTAAEKKLEEAAANSEASPDQAKEADQNSDKMREQIETEFKRCFAERAPKELRFAEAVKLARALYDAMPAR